VGRVGVTEEDCSVVKLVNQIKLSFVTFSYFMLIQYLVCKELGKKFLYMTQLRNFTNLLFYI